LANPQVAANAGDGNVENLSGLLSRHAAEKTHFDHSCFDRIFSGQLCQSVIDGDHHGRPLERNDGGLVERDFRRARAALSRVADARMIDQDLPHDLRSYTHKMRTAPIIRLILLDQTSVGFVN
jgi:hypothetical protein